MTRFDNPFKSDRVASYTHLSDQVGLVVLGLAARLELDLGLGAAGLLLKIQK